jgi:hypothetical protein
MPGLPVRNDELAIRPTCCSARPVAMAPLQRPAIGRVKSQLLRLSQIPPADLDVSVLGQLTPAQLPLGDGLEPRPLEVVRLTHRSGVGRSGSSRWNTRRGTRTTLRYSPISTPASTACRSAFQRATSGNDGWERVRPRAILLPVRSDEKPALGEAR